MRRQPDKAKRSGGWLYGGLGAVVVILAVGGGLLWRDEMPRSPQVATATPDSAVTAALTAAPRRETRPTLDPALFVGKARRAHEVAREIPGVLDRLYCYCACDRHLGHKSLLSCYTDGHAAT